MSKKIETSVEFWEQIISKRNFVENGYDLDATNYIKNELNLFPSRSIFFGLQSKEKKSTPIELEEFIKVFFESMEDFSNMMIDLLNMFKEIAVKQTDKNLDIEFDFDKGKNPTTINLDKFKEVTSFFVNIQKEFEIPNLDIEKLWELPSILYPQEDIVRSASMDEDYSVYDHKEWFEKYPDIQKTGNELLDKQVEKVFYIWKQVIEEIKSYEKKPGETKEDNRRFSRLDDHEWIPVMIAYMKRLVRYDDNVKNIIANNLKNFFNNMPVIKIETTEKIEKFEEFLKLPFWDKRYELYSVWVFSLIYNTTKEYGLRVHTINNKLIFPFRETHLATIDCKEGDILIFSEKRTTLTNPIGKSRTRNIQPDYSFYREPITHTGSSILEIECKQYKKQSTDNFARALIDYSNGRENAKVLVVNYGETNRERVFKKIDKLAIDGIPNNKDRCDVIGNLKPNNNEDILVNIIQDKISEYSCINHSFIFNVSFKVELFWEKPLEDLDLCLEFTENNKTELISYNNKRIDNIWLNKDIQKGSIEAEIITVDKIENGLYHFFVHNFSSDIFDENVVCKIIIDNKLYKEIRPSSYTGKYWKLFDIDTEKNCFVLINEVVNINNIEDKD